MGTFNVGNLACSLQGSGSRVNWEQEKTCKSEGNHQKNFKIRKDRTKNKHSHYRRFVLVVGVEVSLWSFLLSILSPKRASACKRTSAWRSGTYQYRSHCIADWPYVSHPWFRIKQEYNKTYFLIFWQLFLWDFVSVQTSRSGTCPVDARLLSCLYDLFLTSGKLQSKLETAFATSTQ